MKQGGSPDRRARPDKRRGVAGFLFGEIGHEILTLRRQHKVGEDFGSGMVALGMAGRAVGIGRDLQAWGEARTGHLAKTMAFGKPGKVKFCKAEIPGRWKFAGINFAKQDRKMQELKGFPWGLIRYVSMLTALSRFAIVAQL